MKSRKKKKKRFSTAGPGETLNLTEIKTSVYSFAFTFFVSPVQMQCPTLYVNQTFSLVISFDSFFQNIPVYLFLPLKLSVHGTYFIAHLHNRHFLIFGQLASNSP